MPPLARDLELTFLGHQSWLVGVGPTSVLIDPVVLDRFGHDERPAFHIYPPRRVDLDRMPRVEAIVLTHEHHDHFDLASMHALPRSAPVYVGPLMPSCVVRALDAMGFSVRATELESPFRIGDLELTLHAPSAHTTLAESRLTQVHARAPGQRGVYFGIDGLIGERFKASVTSGETPVPRAVVVSNNSQIVPVAGGDNLLPVAARGTSGIDLLQMLVVDSLEGFDNVEHVVLCGNGFTNSRLPFGPYLHSDHKRLATLANELLGAARVEGPLPGERLTFVDSGLVGSRVDWIERDEARWDAMRRLHEQFLRQPRELEARPVVGVFASNDDAIIAMRNLEEELPELARALMRSPVGQAAIRADEYLRGPVGSRRILLRLLGGPGNAAVQLALDLAEARFVDDHTPEDDVLETFPFGAEIHLPDFNAVLEGELSVWSLAGAVRSWSLDEHDNVIRFLADYYGEQLRPDLAWKVYRRVLKGLDAKKT